MSEKLKGVAFWERDTSDRKHLCFIISDSNEFNNVLVVNITDINNKPACYDNVCELDVGDHPSISKPSIVYYGKAKEINISNIFDIDVNVVKNLSIETLKRIQDGAKKKRTISERAKEIFQVFLRWKMR